MDIYGIDQENIIVKRSLRAFKLLIGLIIPGFVWGLLCFVAQAIIGAIIHFNSVNLLLGMMVPYVAFLFIQVIYYTKVFYEGAFYLHQIYIIKEGNSFHIIQRKSTHASSMVLGVKALSAGTPMSMLIGGILLSDAKNSMLHGIDKMELGFIQEILEGKHKGKYAVVTYNNVEFDKENKTKLYFVGDKEKNSSSKRTSFSLKKFYVDWEGLKNV